MGKTQEEGEAGEEETTLKHILLKHPVESTDAVLRLTNGMIQTCGPPFKKPSAVKLSPLPLPAFVVKPSGKNLRSLRQGPVVFQHVTADLKSPSATTIFQYLT